MKRFIFLLLTSVLLIAGCQSKEQGEAQKIAGPQLVSCDPSDGAENLVGEALTVKMLFDRSIRCPEDQKSRINVEGGASLGDIKASTNILEIQVMALYGNQTSLLPQLWQNLPPSVGAPQLGQNLGIAGA